MQGTSSDKCGRRISVMGLGVGAFIQGMLHILRDDGAAVSTYLTRDYAHLGPSLEGPAFDAVRYPDPIPLVRERQVDLLIPMSIDWAQAPWAQRLLDTGAFVLSPLGEGIRIERDRDFARELCRHYNVPFPTAYRAGSRSEVEAILEREPRPYVIKNPLCAPGSPIHTILCETADETRAWLPRLDFSEGVFLQEFMGDQEAGHVAFVQNGEVYPLVTNQEFKRAFTGDMGIVAGGPLGGIVEADPNDRYGLARELIHPLRPWLRSVGYNGPLQVTAIRAQESWQVLEYNIRLGLMCGPIILRMLENPLEALTTLARGGRPKLRFRSDRLFGCSITLAGYGYPFIEVEGPPLPIRVTESFDCDVWWNEVAESVDGGRVATGHRIADVVGITDSFKGAIAQAYRNVRKIRCPASYYRTDIGHTGWPPGGG